MLIATALSHVPYRLSTIYCDIAFNFSEGVNFGREFSGGGTSAVWLFCPGGRLYDPLTPLHPPAKTNRLSLAFVNTAWFRVPPLAMMFRGGVAARCRLHRWRDARLRAMRASGDRRVRPTSAGAMAWEGRAGRSGPMNMSGYRKSPSARICKRKGIRKAAMRWKEARV